ncbi:MAG: hypothetical protein GY795_24500 [Desulfobacterales bacterium]|nr:hypothetical protein [Desulfobacterales bacterium]
MAVGTLLPGDIIEAGVELYDIPNYSDPGACSIEPLPRSAQVLEVTHDRLASRITTDRGPRAYRADDRVTLIAESARRPYRQVWSEEAAGG